MTNEQAPTFEEREGFEHEASDETKEAGLARVSEALLKFREGRLKLAELDNDDLRRENKDLEQENEQLRKLAYHDELTGAKNTRALHETVERRKKESEDDCALMLVDANGFKPINDTYGHDAGNLVLQEIVKYLEELAGRPDDVVARIGGDEFAVIFTGTTEDELRNKLNTESIQFVVDYHGVEIPVSLSFGLTTYKHGEGAAELLRRADEKMYEQKKKRGDSRDSREV